MGARRRHLVSQAQQRGRVGHVRGDRQVAALVRHQLQQPPPGRVLRRLCALLEALPAHVGHARVGARKQAARSHAQQWQELVCILCAQLL